MRIEHKRIALVVILTLAGTLALRADANRWWAHVEALANDGMEGRNTGSPGHKRAADYVAARFKQDGLEPAGINGYIQPVKFKTRTIDEGHSSLALITNEQTEVLKLGEDANISLRSDAAPRLRRRSSSWATACRCPNGSSTTSPART